MDAATEAELAELIEQLNRLANERERMIYWCCRALVQASGETPTREDQDALKIGLRTLLLDLDYDARRVAWMIQAGEPALHPWRTA